MSPKYEIGDLVWAKMKNFSPWPARIVEPQKNMKRPVMKKPMHCVFFFGTQNYAWILEELIWPYEEYKEQYVNKNKSTSFKEAVEAIEDYRVKNPKPVKTISPASSEEDIAVLFPSRSSKSGHIQGYPQTPFLGRPKVISSPSPSKKGLKRPFQGKETPKQKYKFPKIRPLFTSSVGRQNNTVKNTTVDDSSSASAKPSKVRSPVHVNSSPKPGVSVKLPQPPSPVTPPPMVQMNFDSQKGACVSPSKLKFGFLGLGTLGRRILKNLMDSGHSVMIWNRTASKVNQA